MTIKVRQLAERDKERWHQLFQAYIAFYETTVPDDVLAVVWQRIVSGADGFHGLVAVDASDSPEGLANILFHRGTWATTWYCYLEDLFVTPAARGQGTGRALIEAVYQEADKRGAARTYWVTEESNATARSLYDRVAHRAPYVQYRRR